MNPLSQLIQRYQGNLKRTVTGSDFISDSVQLLYYKLHILNCRRGGSYANSLDWIKKKPNPKNKDDKYFQYTVIVTLNYGEIESHPEGVSNIKLFISKYKLKVINYPSKLDDWKTFEKDIQPTVVNILYIKEKEIYPAYNSKINSNCEK